jgi:hypothetical protein
MLTLNEDLESCLSPEEEGIRSGAVKNCFIRLEDNSRMVSIFCPRVDEEDYKIIKDIQGEAIIESWIWNDSGIRLIIKKTKFFPVKSLSGIIERLTGHFAKKYPHSFFKRFRSYPCGNLSTVVLIHINNDLVLKFCQELRSDFTKNFLKVVCSTGKNRYKKIFIHTYEFGTLELKKGIIEMHRWENEDEAQEISYLSRRYTQRILDGVLDDPGVKNAMITTVRKSLEECTIEPDHLTIFTGALDYLSFTFEQRNSQSK